MSPYFCEFCIEIAQEEGAEGEEVLFLTLMGAEIADHLCEEIEDDGYTHCDCSCKPILKIRLRKYL